MLKSIAFVIYMATAASIVASIDNICSFYDGSPRVDLNPEEMAPFVKIGEKFYLVGVQEKVNWYDANFICRRHNSHLASVESATEMHAISHYLKSKNYRDGDFFWLSGTDLAKEGVYYWMGTGQPFTYNYWSAGQPDNYGSGEDCIHLWLRDYDNDWKMNDGRCHLTMHYICEANTAKTFSCSVF